ncbi:MAG: hypothetical protein NTV50_04385 [Planctomycetota bacterium]|nr:hypothetical protein [Planctomycetota bacterium]
MKKISPLGGGDSVSLIVQALVDLEEKEIKVARAFLKKENTTPARLIADKLTKMMVEQSKKRPVINWPDLYISALQPARAESPAVAQPNKVRKSLGSINFIGKVWVLPNGKTVKLPQGRVLEALKALVKGAKLYNIPSRGPFSQMRIGPKNLRRGLMRVVNKAVALGLILPEGRKPRVVNSKLIFTL